MMILPIRTIIGLCVVVCSIPTLSIAGQKVDEVENEGRRLNTNYLNNMALGKPTAQSSTYTDAENGDWVSSLAVDGNKSTATHTTSFGGWWLVDLEETATITRVRVWNRQDCCKERLNGAVIEVMDVHDTVLATQNITEESPDSIDWYFPSIRARYVKIISPDHFLSMSEVEVFGAFAGGWYD